LKAILPSSMPGSRESEYTNPFVITVYVECEMAEELEEVVAEEARLMNKDNDYLEPMEINL
jgi:hypothetical protein